MRELSTPQRTGLPQQHGPAVSPTAPTGGAAGPPTSTPLPSGLLLCMAMYTWLSTRSASLATYLQPSARRSCTMASRTWPMLVSVRPTQ
jgi:hypothetical protein